MDDRRWAHAEETHQSLQAKYAGLLDRMLDAWVMVDMTGCIVEYNDAFRDMLGYLDEEIHGLAFEEITPPVWHEMERTIVREQVIKNGSSELYEKEYRRKDGTIIPVELRSYLYHDSEGTPVGIWAIIRDISARKQVEEMAHRNEERLRSVADNLPVLMFQFYATESGEYGTNYESGRIREILGLSGDSESFFDEFAAHILEEDQAPFMASIQRAVADFAPWDFEFRYVKPCGGIIWLHGMSTPFRDEGCILFNGVILEITERKQVEAALKESELKFKSIMAQSTLPMSVYDAEGFLMEVNAACLQMWEFDAEKALGRYNILTDQNRSLAHPYVLKAFQGEPANLPEHCFDPGLSGYPGNKCWVTGRAYPLKDQNGVVKNVVIITEDITERKHAEEELRKLSLAVEQSPVLVVITDPEGTIEYVNPKFSEVTGYSIEEVRGKNPRILKSGHTPAEQYTELWAAIKAGKTWKGEFQNRRKDGTLFWERAHISSIRDVSGAITHFIAMKEDITEQKALEVQFRQSQKMESVGRLAGGVAHDFNNLLAVILGYGELLRSDIPEDSPMQEYLGQIMEAGDRAKALTRQLLAFSRKQVLEMKRVDVNDVVHGLEKMLRRLLGEDIAVWVHLVPRACCVKADPAQLEQVLMNLCVNARDAMPGGGALTIETDFVELDDEYAAAHPNIKPGMYVMCSVSDTGYGMDMETQRQIFEPFFTTKGVGKGTGLGLATVYGIVKQHGGEVWVYSEPGHGSTFRMYLPAVASTEDSLERDPKDEVVPGQGEVILLLEDDTAVRELAGRMLERLGYSVIMAKNAQECLALARTAERIDLLITDVVMPGLNGRQVSDQLKQNRPDLRVLFMSGYTEDAIAHHGVLEEGIHFINKPFNLMSLSRKVRESLTL